VLLPLFLARERIKRDDRAVSDGLGPDVDRAAPQNWRRRRSRYRDVRQGAAAPVIAAFDVFDLLPSEDACVILPRGDVKQPRARAVGGRIPVRPALIARPGRLPRRLGCLDRAAAGLEL